MLYKGVFSQKSVRFRDIYTPAALKRHYINIDYVNLKLQIDENSTRNSDKLYLSKSVFTKKMKTFCLVTQKFIFLFILLNMCFCVLNNFVQILRKSLADVDEFEHAVHKFEP